MTKLVIMSDLHIDVNDFGDFEYNTLISLLKEKEISHLHLAGDISNDLEDVTKPFLEKLSQHVHLTYNLGNHDMLGLDEKTIQAQDGQILELPGRSLIHLAGWYDYGFNTTKTDEEHLTSKNFYWFDRKLDRPLSDPEITKDSLDKLERLLLVAKQPAIVAMHFVPHQSFIPDHPYFQRFNAFLGSPRFHNLFVQRQVTDVVFGHLHHRHDRVIGGVRYQARPLGYKREWQMIRQFLKQHPHLVTGPNYELAKRYRDVKDKPEFQEFYQKYLKKELSDALIRYDLSEI
ncbi:metallophosphoesterase [Streptococcus moroccensis]|uniref:Phosphoesterase n=1 Tax=Streptococcus moroccensis TaxID=1451356 RepID=A0ABT9YSF2_9STRE|nr:metallophosphoesterase [Streptococcus moroccensis]MDQ0222649.1 putative phosphoesterase [Streptococcus moroccensis]